MNITSSSTGRSNIVTFAAKTRSKAANITPRGELGVMLPSSPQFVDTFYSYI